MVFIEFLGRGERSYLPKGRVLGTVFVPAEVNMVSQSWDGKRVYFTSSLLANWDKTQGAQGDLQFFKAYTEKVWGTTCDRISAEWGAQRVKSLSVAKALLHALGKLVGLRAAGDAEAHQMDEDYIRALEYGLRVHRGARFPKRYFVGVHQAQFRETEVAHRSCGGANIQRIARLNQNNPHHAAARGHNAPACGLRGRAG